MSKESSGGKKSGSSKPSTGGENDAPAAKKSKLPAARVRMFRQGLGDCFLVTLNVGGNRERNILIDCGTLGNKSNQYNIESIADYIDDTLGKTGRIDVVIATHEHRDHLSGFDGQMKRLKDRVDRVWLAWTENPKDPDAGGFAKNKRDLGKALAGLALAAPAAAVSQHIADLLGFAGDVTLGAAKFGETVNDAMEFVRTGLGAKA